MGPESGGRGSCCQQVAEKLEKSEAGRKKLRQAITLLKEKMEATEKVLQVNETLRQELEKERKRAEAESMNAKEQMRLREELEKDGCKLKDELARVLQRLDAVERRQKVDSNGVHCLLSEVRGAAKSLGHSVVAIESAQNAFQGLENSLLTKIQSASKSAEKGMDLATKLQSDASAARTKCVAAETMSRTAHSIAMSTQTEVQKLSVNIVALQKQTSVMEQQLSLLQGQGRTSEVKATAPTTATRDSMPNAYAKSKSKSKFGRGMLLSKTQVQSTPLIQGHMANKGGSDLVASGEMVSNTSFAPLTTGAVQAGRILTPNTSKVAPPASVTAVDTLSAHVESLEKHNSLLEQRISSLLQGGAQTDDTGKIIFTMDAAGDRMSSGHIRPRNRSKAGKETLLNSPQVQITQAVETSEPCKADSKENGIALGCAQKARPEERKEGSGEKMSQICSLTELSVKAGALTDNLVDSRRKDSSLEDKPMAIVQSITRLLQKGNKNQTKMQSKLEALEEVLVNIQSKGNGNVCSTDSLQKEGENRLKRKKGERKVMSLGVGDGEACISQKKRKCKEQRKRARKEDSTHEKHTKGKAGFSLEADASYQPAEKLKLNGRGYPLEVAIQTSGKPELHEQVKLKVDLSCLDHESEDGEAVWLNSCVTEKDIPVWSEWDLTSGCDDPLWADWLAGKLQLLSPPSPIFPVGAEKGGLCVVDVGAIGGQELLKTREGHSEDENSHLDLPQVMLVDMQGADGNCPKQTLPSNGEACPQVSEPTFLIQHGSSSLDLCGYPENVDEKLPVIQPMGGDHGWKELPPAPVHLKSCHSCSITLSEQPHESGGPPDGKASENVVENSSALQSIGDEGLRELRPALNLPRSGHPCTITVLEKSSEDAVLGQGGGPENMDKGCYDSCREHSQEQDHLKLRHSCGVMFHQLPDQARGADQGGCSETAGGVRCVVPIGDGWKEQDEPRPNHSFDITLREQLCGG